MKVGFTGTRNGMTSQQINMFQDLVVKLFYNKGVAEFHHGDCVGADADAHDIMESFNAARTDKVMLHIHPPVDDKLQAKRTADVVHEPDTYLARNRKIVNAVDAMIACPPTNTEMKRGGTWYTINYSRKTNTEIYIIYPNGRIELEQAKS